MPDAIGTLEFPAQVQGGGEALGDATLQKFGAYLSAVLRSNLDAAWQQAAPNVPIIRTLGLFDPEIAGLNVSELPGLYVFRSDMQSERMADDWKVDHSEITVLWLPDPAVQAQLTKRMPFLNAVAKSIAMALILGRDPSWVDPGDTDPDAASRGSAIATRANLILEPQLKSCRSVIATVVNDREKAHYPAVRAKIDAHELSSWDLSLRGVPAAHQTTLAIDGFTVGVVRDPTTPEP